MALYTSTYLKGLSKNRSLNESTRFFSSNLKSQTSFDIFLSHSFLDKDEVEGLYLELSKLGYSVYVDWIVDPHLNRNNVTKESASLIRLRMLSCKSLLLATSTNSAISKWAPWELGYIDGNTSKCAIIPISSETIAPNSYKGVEYLSLYQFVKKVPTIGLGEKLFIIEEANKYVLFDDWLRKGIQPQIQSINIF
jgi:hypothetical protein